MEHPPIVCQYDYDDGLCSGTTEVRVDPLFIYELYDEVQYVAMCDYHYRERKDDV